MLLTYIKTESANPMKFKFIVQKFVYEYSFYSLDEYFELQKVKFIYIWSKLVFENFIVALCISIHWMLHTNQCTFNTIIY